MRSQWRAFTPSGSRRTAPAGRSPSAASRDSAAPAVQCNRKHKRCRATSAMPCGHTGAARFVLRVCLEQNSLSTLSICRRALRASAPAPMRQARRAGGKMRRLRAWQRLHELHADVEVLGEPPPLPWRRRDRRRPGLHGSAMYNPRPHAACQPHALQRLFAAFAGSGPHRAFGRLGARALLRCPLVQPRPIHQHRRYRALNSDRRVVAHG